MRILLSQGKATIFSPLKTYSGEGGETAEKTNCTWPMEKATNDKS